MFTHIKCALPHIYISYKCTSTAYTDPFYVILNLTFSSVWFQETEKSNIPSLKTFWVSITWHIIEQVRVFNGGTVDVNRNGMGYDAMTVIQWYQDGG